MWTDPERFLFLKEETQLEKLELILEHNILDMAIMHFVVMKYFNYDPDKYSQLLTNYIICCRKRMLATHIIDK